MRRLQPVQIVESLNSLLDAGSRLSLRSYGRLSFLRALSWQVGLQSLTGSTGGGCHVRLLTSECQIAGPAISGPLPLTVALTRKYPQILATLFASLTRG